MATMPQLIALIMQKFRDQYGESIWSKLLWIFRRLYFLIRSWFFDIEYIPVDMQKLEEALEDWKETVLNYLQYIPEIQDCDDFAMYFKTWLQKWTFENTNTPSNGVGIAIGLVSKDGELLGGHAWNIVLVRTDQGEKVVFVEPQLGEIINNNRSDDGYDYVLQAVII